MIHSALHLSLLFSFQLFVQFSIFFLCPRSGHREAYLKLHHPSVSPSVRPCMRGSCLKSCLSRNSITTEAKSTKNHRKIKHNKKVCCIHDLGCHAQGQGHCHGLKVKMCFCSSHKTAEVTTIKLHRKVKHNKICHI